MKKQIEKNVEFINTIQSVSFLISFIAGDEGFELPIKTTDLKS